MTAKRWLLILIGTTAILRLAWAASLGPGNDEAYFRAYTEHLDWSYFDHPPMVAWLAWTGLRVAGGSGWILGMRWVFVALFAGSTWLMFRLTSRFCGDRAGLAAAFILNATGYFSLAAGSFALPDGPLLFFWLLVLDLAADALTASAATRAGLGRWVAVGLAWGGALLSKYHAVLLPLGLALFMVLEPRGRAWLRRPGPYMALAIGAVLFSPVVAWNMAHGWSSFLFQGSRAIADGATPRVDRLVMAVGGQSAYMFPWVWFVLIAALFVGVRAWRLGQSSQVERFFLSQSLLPLAAFLVVGCWQSLLPHWSLVGLIGVVPLAGVRLARSFDRRPRRGCMRVALWLAMPAAVGAVVLLHTNVGLFQREGRSLAHWLAPSHDPSLDLYGWREVAQAMREANTLKPNDAYVFTSKWYHSSQLAFALSDGRQVLCYSNRAALGYGDWSRPEDWVGRDGVLAVVNHSSTEPAAFDRWFERVEPIGRVSVTRAGAPVKVVQLYRCVNQIRPFPFSREMQMPTEASARLAHRARASSEERTRR